MLIARNSIGSKLRKYSKFELTCIGGDALGLSGVRGGWWKPVPRPICGAFYFFAEKCPPGSLLSTLGQKLSILGVFPAQSDIGISQYLFRLPSLPWRQGTTRPQNRDDRSARPQTLFEASRNLDLPPRKLYDPDRFRFPTCVFCPLISCTFLYFSCIPLIALLILPPVSMGCVESDCICMMGLRAKYLGQPTLHSAWSFEAHVLD